jgi:aspartyl/asparaginyl-tRNA synthetase
VQNNSKVYISQLKDNIQKEITLEGWLYNSRASGKIQFLIIRDGTGLCQCIVEKGKVSDDLFEELKHLGQESSLKITGTIRQEARSVGGYELAVTGAQIISPAVDYPITPKSHGVDFLLKNRHLHFRSQRQWCIGKIRHTVIDAIRTFFNDNGFILIDTRGQADPFRSRLFRLSFAPYADRPVARRIGRDELRQSILLRPDFQGRKKQDPPPPHRVLDGRAGSRLH